jgi:hypothetical protein
VELGPADLRTVEGKIVLADKMLDAYGPGLISPDRYMALRTIGRLDDLDDPIADDKTHARRENDAVREGKPITSMLYHHHACHMREHRRELLNLELAPPTPQLMQQITTLLNHITQHDQQWQMAPLGLLKATGQEPHPMASMGPMGPPGAEAGPPPPPGAGPMPPPPGGGPANANGMPPMDMGPGGPNLPALPNVAGTGEPFAPGQAPPGAAA